MKTTIGLSLIAASVALSIAATSQSIDAAPHPQRAGPFNLAATISANRRQRLRLQSHRPFSIQNRTLSNLPRYSPSQQRNLFSSTLTDFNATSPVIKSTALDRLNGLDSSWMKTPGLAPFRSADPTTVRLNDWDRQRLRMFLESRAVARPSTTYLDFKLQKLQVVEERAMPTVQQVTDLRLLKDRPKLIYVLRVPGHENRDWAPHVRAALEDQQYAGYFMTYEETNPPGGTFVADVLKFLREAGDSEVVRDKAREMGVESTVELIFEIVTGGEFDADALPLPTRMTVTPMPWSIILHPRATATPIPSRSIVYLIPSDFFLSLLAINDAIKRRP